MNDQQVYPKFYRKDARCIRRTSDLKCTEIQLPERAEDKLPLVIHTVTFPYKERFEEAIKEMEEVNEDVFDQYMLNFTGRVERDISRPLTDRAIRRELSKGQNLPKL